MIFYHKCIYVDKFKFFFLYLVRIHQIDVHNLFLYGDLDKEVYISLPYGFFSVCYRKFIDYTNLNMMFIKFLTIGSLRLLLPSSH